MSHLPLKFLDLFYLGRGGLCCETYGQVDGVFSFFLSLSSRSCAAGMGDCGEAKTCTVLPKTVIREEEEKRRRGGTQISRVDIMFACLGQEVGLRNGLG